MENAGRLLRSVRRSADRIPVWAWNHESWTGFLDGRFSALGRHGDLDAFESSRCAAAIPGWGNHGMKCPRLSA